MAQYITEFDDGAVQIISEVELSPDGSRIVAQSPQEIWVDGELWTGDPDEVVYECMTRDYVVDDAGREHEVASMEDYDPELAAEGWIFYE